MSNEKIKQLLARRTCLIEEMGTLTHLLHGTWIERYSVCSRKGCRCHQGDRHGPRYYVVVNENGRQRQKYVPLPQMAATLEGVEQGQRLQTIVEEITRINLELIKERAYADS
jgi:hypothetical protein